MHLYRFILTIWLTYHYKIQSSKLIKRIKICEIGIQIPALLGIANVQSWEVETWEITTDKHKDCKYKKYLDFTRNIDWRVIS